MMSGSVFIIITLLVFIWFGLSSLVFRHPSLGEGLGGPSSFTFIELQHLQVQNGHVFRL